MMRMEFFNLFLLIKTMSERFESDWMNFSSSSIFCFFRFLLSSSSLCSCVLSHFFCTLFPNEPKLVCVKCERRREKRNRGKNERERRKRGLSEEFVYFCYSTLLSVECNKKMQKLHLSFLSLSLSCLILF